MRDSPESSKKFIINARWTMGLLKYKLFFVFLVGRDNRTEHFISSDERRHNQSVAKALVYTGIFAWFLMGVFVLSFSILYIAKTYAGIDLVKGGHPFPSFLKKIRVCH